MPKNKASLHDKKLVWKLKKRAKKMPHFPEGEIEGKVVYTNHEAVPPKPGQKSFDWRNIEWVAVRDLVTYTGRNRLYWAKMKVKGRAPQRAVLKAFPKPESVHYDIPEVIKRLEDSKVPRAKMHLLYFGSGLECGMLIEPFLRTVSVKSKSPLSEIKAKFSPSTLLVAKLRLSDGRDRGIFEQVVNATAEMAKKGLYFRQLWSLARSPKVDVFTIVNSKEGGEKVIALDIESVRVGPNPQKCWKKSEKVLLTTVSFKKPENVEIAKQIIKKTANEFELE